MTASRSCYSHLFLTWLDCSEDTPNTSDHSRRQSCDKICFRIFVYKITGEIGGKTERNIVLDLHVLFLLARKKAFLLVLKKNVITKNSLKIFLLSKHILHKKNIVIMKKIRFWDFDMFIRFKVSWISLCYFYGYVYMCAHVWITMMSKRSIGLSSNLVCILRVTVEKDFKILVWNF